MSIRIREWIKEHLPNVGPWTVVLIIVGVLIGSCFVYWFL
jgi:hypothetical protein